MNNNLNIRINLTGDNELDRHNLFTYIVNNFTFDETESDVLVLAASFIALDSREIFSEINANPDIMVPLCLLLMKEEKIHLTRRAQIATALSRFSDVQARTVDKGAKRKPLFNFTNEYEEALYTKFSGIAVVDVAVNYPFFRIYYERGVIYEALKDYPNAYRMYSKAHQWNPFNPKAIVKILEALKHDMRSEDLLRLGMWYLQTVYSLPNISAALRYVGYALYLQGEFAKAYAFYFQSIVYDEDGLPLSFNEEIKSVLTALGRESAYELKTSEIKKLFPNIKERPVPSDNVFDTIRQLIINHYVKENYVEVLRYATHYVFYRPSDDKISRILKVSKLNLN